MTPPERAFPTDADRRALIAIRANALRRIVQPIAMASEQRKLRFVREMAGFAQNSDTLALPVSRQVRTELDIQIVEPDPALGGEASDRVFDLAHILRAEHWPLPWYAVASHQVDDEDRRQIAALVDAYASAAAARDETAAMALYAIDGDPLEMERRWFRRHVIDAKARIERVAGYAIAPRFDARRALLGSREAPPLRLRTVADGGVEQMTVLSLSAVRSVGGWQLG